MVLSDCYVLMSIQVLQYKPSSSGKVLYGALQLTLAAQHLLCLSLAQVMVVKAGFPYKRRQISIKCNAGLRGLVRLATTSGPSNRRNR